jgi:hypothetical protein
VTRLVVEAAFGYSVTDAAAVWTDITRWVDIAAGVRITRGASDELSDTQPGTCTLRLDNSDGRFTPGSAASPYHPHVRKNTPLRVGVLTAVKNLLREGDFEASDTISDYDSWGEDADQGPILWATDNTRAHHGSYSLRVAWENTAVGYPGIVQTTVYGLTPGQDYTASAWVWVDTAEPSPPVRLQIDDGAAASPASTTTGAWEKLTCTFTATSTSHTLQFTATATTADGGQAWLDEVQVEEGAAATAFDTTSIGRLHWRFHGVVNEWPISWNGLYSTVTITCTDLFKLLARQDELQAMLIEEVLLDGPLAYYPLSEPQDSVSAGDIAGHAAGSLSIVQVGSGGSLTFGQDATGPRTGLPVPVFTPASSSAGKNLFADLGAAFAAASSVNYLYAEGWFSTTTRGRVIYGVSSADNDFQLVFSLDSVSGQMVIEWTINAAPVLSSTMVPCGDLADGAAHHFVYDEFNGRLYVDGTGYVVSVTPMMDLRRLRVGAWAANRLWSGTISHVALHAPPTGTTAPGDYTSHYTVGATEMIGETAAARMSRLAGYVGLTVTSQGSTFDGMASQKALGRSPLEHMRDIETTESGRLFAARDGAHLVFQSRDVRYNPVPLATLAYADADTDAIVFDDDDQKMVNILVATRPGGATQRVADAASRAVHGAYEQAVELLKATDAKVIDAAWWLLSRYADPPPEMRQLPVQAATLPLATYRALLDADISSALTVTDLPDQAPAATVTVTVEGYTETITNNQHHLDFHTSRAQLDSVWILGDTTYSVLDATTRLAY